MFEWLFSLALALMPRSPASLHSPLGNLLKAPQAQVIVRSHVPSRQFRGDWQAPDVVFVGFTTDWGDALLPMVHEISLTTATAIIVPPDERAAGRAWHRTHLRHRRNVRTIELDFDSLWVRDYGPLQTFERDGTAVWLDGEYAEDRPADDVMPAHLSRAWSARWEALPYRLDGGAIISNGEGLCASTLEAFENADIAIHDARSMDALLGQLGCSVLALLPALGHDETKHADMFAQFTATNRVMVADIDPGEDGDDAERMESAVRGLMEAADAMGISLEVIRVPMPIGRDHIYHTYLNGLQLPGAFLAPSYHAVPYRREAEAYRALAEALPGLEIVPIPADDMIELEGAIHCVALGVNR